jgi:hypothetical protein
VTSVKSGADGGLLLAMVGGSGFYYGFG